MIYLMRLYLDWRMKHDWMRRKCILINSIRIHMVSVRNGNSFRTRISFSFFLYFDNKTKHKMNNWKQLKQTSVNYTVHTECLFCHSDWNFSGTAERAYPDQMCENLDRNFSTERRIESNRMEWNGIVSKWLQEILFSFIG